MKHRIEIHIVKDNKIKDIQTKITDNKEEIDTLIDRATKLARLNNITINIYTTVYNIVRKPIYIR